MKLKKTLVFAGFGGQGVLTAGRIMCDIALGENLNATWLPAYGFAMRGGKANCTVKLCDGEIGAPTMESIDLLVAMNVPSMEFVDNMAPGGTVVANADLVPPDHPQCSREDLQYVFVPCDSLARQAKNPRAANVVSVGAVAGLLGFDTAGALKALEGFFAGKGKGDYTAANAAAFMGGCESAQQPAAHAAVKGG